MVERIAEIGPNLRLVLLLGLVVVLIDRWWHFTSRRR